MKFLIRILINSLALLGIAYYISGIEIENYKIALISALVLGIANAIIRPIVKILTLPITILTLGLFSLVINVLFFWLVAYFVPGFEVLGVVAAIKGALLMAVVGWLSNMFLKK